MSGIGPISPGVQHERIVYTPGTYTWVKPAWAKTIEVELWGPGMGGGSGRRGAASSTNRCGGGGGGSGSYARSIFAAADLPATVNVFVGVGQAGGTSVTANDTDGNSPAQSGITNTYFGPTLATAYAMARGGASSGAGGTNATSAAGGLGGIGMVQGSAGATGTNAAGTGRSATNGPTQGGGGGGGVTITTDAEGAGGTGFWPGILQALTAPANGGAVHANGGPGVAAPIATVAGASGGGGGGGHAAAAGNGGAGTSISAGGGGGGGSTNGFASGAGGAGGPGRAIITSYG